MSGNTGKMTAAAIAARGPRMCLTSVHAGAKFLGFVVRREGHLGAIVNAAARQRFDLSYKTWAKSYSLPYLMRIGSALTPKGGAR